MATIRKFLLIGLIIVSLCGGFGFCSADDTSTDELFKHEDEGENWTRGGFELDSPGNTLYERYNVSDNDDDNCYGTIWCAMTFSTDTEHVITQIAIRLLAVGSPSSVGVIGIYDTSAGLPTGTQFLASTTLDTSLSTDPSSFITVDLVSTTTIATNHTYAIVYYDENGALYDYENRNQFKPTLSFTEYTLKGFSQERPEELPNYGDIIWVRDSKSEKWRISHFIKKEDNKYYASL